MPNTTNITDMRDAARALRTQLVAQYDYLTDAPEVLAKLLSSTATCLFCVGRGNYNQAKILISEISSALAYIENHDKKWHVFKDDALNNNWHFKFLAPILARISNCVKPLEAEINAKLMPTEQRPESTTPTELRKLPSLKNTKM